MKEITKKRELRPVSVRLVFGRPLTLIAAPVCFSLRRRHDALR
jgi:hypothetical protein